MLKIIHVFWMGCNFFKAQQTSDIKARFCKSLLAPNCTPASLIIIVTLTFEIYHAQFTPNFNVVGGPLKVPLGCAKLAGKS